jgi:hypothetical protein
MAEIQLAPQYETGIVGNGGMRYNIQMARDAAGCWHQRHIWFRDDYRGEHNPPLIDPWIVSGTGRTGPESHYKPVSTIAAGCCATCHQSDCSCSAKQWLGVSA